jgi:hypothetical protein
MDQNEKFAGACEALYEATSNIADGELPEGIEPLVAILRDMKWMITHLRETQGQIQYEIHIRMAQMELKSVSMPDGALVRRTGKWQRREVDRDGLVSFVRELSLQESVDKITGELEGVDARFSEHLLDCFRQEPRWGHLAKLGLDEDEYCSKNYVLDVTVVEPS